MARWAIGDLQGCCDEFGELLQRIKFRADRDQLWLTGDLVNRGPQSLATLRLVHAMRDNLVTVLGNHDLHLLALATLPARQPRRKDTLAAVLTAPDRQVLLDWLVAQPLAHHDLVHGDLLVHAGLVPQWDARLAAKLSGEVQQALQDDAAGLFNSMYGDQPDAWREDLHGAERLRFIVNVLTRLRFCTVAGHINLQLKGAPAAAAAPWLPWFRIANASRAATRIIFGHWSALGFLQERGLLALDTGCVWGGTLTAVNLDQPDLAPVSVPSRQTVWREA